MSLSRTLKNRQEDPHALTVTIPDYSLSYANKSQANEVATRICCQGILYHSMYAKHSWGWKQIFGEAFEQYLSIQKKYCERKSWKLFQESRKRWQNSAKANSCCPVKYGKLSRILFSAIMECTWHYWKQEKKIRRSLLCCANNFTSALTLLDCGKQSLAFICPSYRSWQLQKTIRHPCVPRLLLTT